MNGITQREQLPVRPYFDRTMTLYIKGIALLCMLVHHFFTFPDRYIPGIEYPYLDLFARIFQAPMRICVSSFAFLTGYFYFFNKKKTLAYSLKKDYQLLISYWTAFLVLLGLALLGGFRFQPKDILLEMLTFKKDLMVDSWYVQFYLIAMLILPVLVRFMPKKGIGSYLVGLVIPVIIFTLIKEFAPEGIARIAKEQQQWFTSIMSGYLVAQNDLFAGSFDPARDRLKKPWQKILLALVLMGSAMLMRRFFTFGIFGVVLLSRSITFQIYMDVFYAPMFIYGALTFLQQVHLPKILQKILAAIGKLSLPMWFAHGLFFSVAKEVFQPIAFLPREPLAVLVWATFLTYILAWCMDKIAGFILKKR